MRNVDVGPDRRPGPLATLGGPSTSFTARWTRACWTGLALVSAGCSERDDRTPVYPVSGKVMIRGAVPEGALVVLHPLSAGKPDGPRPAGRVRKDGSFRLTTYEEDDGAPIGDYVATIEWNPLVTRGGEAVAGPNRAPRAYTDRDASPWRVAVDKGDNRLAPTYINK